VQEIVERHLTPMRDQKPARHSGASGNPLR
jgi:hypothetical protein